MSAAPCQGANSRSEIGTITRRDEKETPPIAPSIRRRRRSTRMRSDAYRMRRDRRPIAAQTGRRHSFGGSAEGAAPSASTASDGKRRRGNAASTYVLYKMVYLCLITALILA